MPRKSSGSWRWPGACGWTSTRPGRIRASASGAQLVIESAALKYTRLRSLTRQLRGEPAGPEGSILKLGGSELGVRIGDVAGELLGLHALVNRPSEIVPDAPRWFNRVLAARQYTISAGPARSSAACPRADQLTRTTRGGRRR